MSTFCGYIKNGNALVAQTRAFLFSIVLFRRLSVLEN